MIRRLGLLLLVLILIGAAFVGWLVKGSFASTSDSEEVIVVEVESGVGVSGLADELVEQGLIKHRLVFLVDAFVTGRWSSLKAGEFEVPKNSSPVDILYIVSTGDVVDPRVRVTLIEGWTSQQIAEKLEDEGLVDAQDYLDVVETGEGVNSPVTSIIPEGKSLEGFLFPDTYLFQPDASAADIVTKQLKTFESKVLLPLADDFESADLEVYETVTLASIVEREVAPDSDRALVAGVFHNRLDINMALQSDATINYVTGKGLAAPSAKDLQVVSPYNTYKNPGLPPTPISNPGYDSVYATLNPEDSDYLYFLTDLEGNAYFSETFEQHKIYKEQYVP